MGYLARHRRWVDTGSSRRAPDGLSLMDAPFVDALRLPEVVFAASKVDFRGNLDFGGDDDVSTNSRPNRTGSRRIDAGWLVDVGNV